MKTFHQPLAEMSCGVRRLDSSRPNVGISQNSATSSRKIRITPPPAAAASRGRDPGPAAAGRRSRVRGGRLARVSPRPSLSALIAVAPFAAGGC